MKLDCIGFGALNVDHLCRVDHIAQGGEESMVREKELHLGGSAANAMVGLARLGHSVGYIGKVGDDEFGRLLLNDLENEGVDAGGVIISRTGISGQVIGYIDPSGERALYVYPGVNDTIDIREVDLNFILNCRSLHLTSFMGELSFQTQKILVESTSLPLISFDPGMIYALKGYKAMKPILAHTYVVLPNLHELQLLTGKGLIDGSRLLIQEGAQIVAVKLGFNGCYVTNGVEEHWIEAYPVEVVDTTGAGDAFCAGFLHGLLNDRDLQTCGMLGNFVASKKITRMGAREGLPRCSEVDL